MSYFVASNNSARIPEAIAAAADVLPKLFTQRPVSQVFCCKWKLIICKRLISVRKCLSDHKKKQMYIMKELKSKAVKLALVN